jgi:Glycosyl transferase family 2
MRDLDGVFRIAHGAPDPHAVTAYAIVKNEMFYMASFLDHHRRIGVQQFLIVDDRSSDGTREYLASQPDCVVLESDLSFGDPVEIPGAAGPRRTRAGIAFKSWLPQRFLRDQYALYLDADEYFVLPGGYDTLGGLFEDLARHDIAAVCAPMVDFYPGTITDMDTPRTLPTAAAMLGAHAYFDAVPLLGWKAGQDEPVRLNENASTRLFRKHRIKTVPERMQRAPRWLNRWLPYAYPTTNVLKTPIVRWRDGAAYVNSHWANVAPTRKVMVGVAHLKFTYDLSRRTAYALESKVYVRGSRKYQWYEELLDAMRRGDRSFLGPRSRRYTGPDDFAAAGLTRCDLDNPDRDTLAARIVTSE